MPLTAIAQQNSVASSQLLTPSTSIPSPVTTQATPFAFIVPSETPTISHTPLIPPGFSPLPQSSSTPYTPIPTMPYGFAPFNPYSVFDPPLAMVGFFAGRNIGRFNNSRSNMGRFDNSSSSFGNQVNSFFGNNSGIGGGLT